MNRRDENSPSGTATTIRVTDIIRIFTKAMPFSLAVLEKSPVRMLREMIDRLYEPHGNAFTQLDKKSNHQGGEENETRDAAQFGD